MTDGKPTQIDLDRAKEYGRLKREKREKQARINDIDKRLAVLEPRLLDQFSAAELRNLHLTGVGTLYLQKRGWARIVREGEEATPEERARANEALRAAGLDEYVAESFNTQSLSARLREMLENGEKLPEELEGAIRFDVEYTLAHRGS